VTYKVRFVWAEGEHFDCAGATTIIEVEFSIGSVSGGVRACGGLRIPKGIEEGEGHDLLHDLAFSSRVSAEAKYLVCEEPSAGCLS